MMLHERHQNRVLHLQGRNSVMRDGTEAFLSWAISREDHGLSVPRRPGELGGYQDLMKQPGARAAVRQYWRRALA